MSTPTLKQFKKIVAEKSLDEFLGFIETMNILESDDFNVALPGDFEERKQIVMDEYAKRFPIEHLTPVK